MSSNDLALVGRLPCFLAYAICASADERYDNNLTASGLFFEDFQVGQKVNSAGRTVTEHDIATFAGLSGDFNQIHTDAEFARVGMFGERIAHGLLILSVASGLAWQLGFIAGTADAFLSMDWKFAGPTKIGAVVRSVGPSKLVAVVRTLHAAAACRIAGVGLDFATAKDNPGVEADACGSPTERSGSPRFPRPSRTFPSRASLSSAAAST